MCRCNVLDHGRPMLGVGCSGPLEVRQKRAKDLGIVRPKAARMAIENRISTVLDAFSVKPSSSIIVGHRCCVRIMGRFGGSDTYWDQSFVILVPKNSRFWPAPGAGHMSYTEVCYKNRSNPPLPQHQNWLFFPHQLLYKNGNQMNSSSSNLVTQNMTGAVSTLTVSTRPLSRQGSGGRPPMGEVRGCLALGQLDACPVWPPVPGRGQWPRVTCGG